MGITKNGRDFQAFQPLDPAQLFRAVIGNTDADQAVHAILAVREDTQQVAGAEVTVHGGNAAGQKAASLLKQGACRTGVHPHSSARVGLIGHPVFAAGNGMLFRAYPGADNFSTKSPAQNILFPARQDQSRHTKLRRSPGGQ